MLHFVSMLLISWRNSHIIKFKFSIFFRSLRVYCFPHDRFVCSTNVFSEISWWRRSFCWSYGHSALWKMQECKEKNFPYRTVFATFLHHLANVLCLDSRAPSLSLASQYTFIFMSKNYKARFFLRKSSQSTTTKSDFRFQ